MKLLEKKYWGTQIKSWLIYINYIIREIRTICKHYENVSESAIPSWKYIHSTSMKQHQMVVVLYDTQQVNTYVCWKSGCPSKNRKKIGKIMQHIWSWKLQKFKNVSVLTLLLEIITSEHCRLCFSRKGYLIK